MYYKIDDFKYLVLKTLNDAIIRFNLVESTYESQMSQDQMVVLRNEFDIVKIYLDGTSVYIEIVDPKNNEEYLLHLIYKILLNEVIKVDFKENNIPEKVEKTLLFYNKILTTDLDHLLMGDFSWVDDYHNYVKSESEIHQALWRLNPDNPIFIKFRNRDLTWKSDILRLIKNKK